MSFKAPSVKELSFVISSTGTGASGIWSDSDYDASAPQLDSGQGTYQYMKVTDNGRPTDASSNPGTVITLPNNIVIVGTQIVVTTRFRGYTGYGAPYSLADITLDSSSDPSLFIGPTWSDADAQTVSDAGTKLVLPLGLRINYGTLTICNGISEAAGTYSTGHYMTVTAGGVLGFGYARSYNTYGVSTTDNSSGRLAQGLTTYTIFYKDL